jgi:hypothetical protein
MPRLKTAVVEPRGSRTGTDASAKATKAKPKLGGKKRSGNSPGKTIVKAPKERVFLTKDQQALLILRYMELSKSKQKKSTELRELCMEFDVHLSYPGKLCAKLKETKELPTRDGVGGAPVRMMEEEVTLLTQTLEEHAYDLTYRQIETLTGIPATSIWRYVKETEGWKEVRKGTRPLLKEANREGRMRWAEEHEDDEFELQIDLDEKIFYAWTASGTLKLPAGVEKPKTALQSKRFIPNVMCLTGIGKPNKKHKWDGKLGIWPIGKLRPALRGDKRTGLQKGDMIWESATLDGERWEDMLLTLVFPAVRALLPKAKVVKLQFDNAPGHKTGADRSDAMIKAMKGRPSIEFVEQIAQSPCTNLCDLGFFRSIDSRLPKLRSFKVPEFIEQIKTAYEEYPEDKIENLVKMKKRVVVCLSENEGRNDFKLPHSVKGV